MMPPSASVLPCFIHTPAAQMSHVNCGCAQTSAPGAPDFTARSSPSPNAPHMMRSSASDGGTLPQSDDVLPAISLITLDGVLRGLSIVGEVARQDRRRPSFSRDRVAST